MLKRPWPVLILVVCFNVLIDNTSAQSPSDCALIRRPVLQDPMIWKLSRSVTNQFWSIDLFNFPRSNTISYIASPSYELLSGVEFTLDESWNRIIYIEAKANWIREYGSFGQVQCQNWWPTSIECLAPCNNVGYSDYYYVYLADTKNNRIVRIRYDWFNQIVGCDQPITGLGLNRPADLNLNDGRSFYTIGEDDFPSSQNNYLWVVNAPNGSPYEIKRITVGGVLKKTYGTYGCNGASGTFCKITAIVSSRSAFSATPYSNGDHFYVADVGNHRVVWLIKETNGETINWWGQVPTGSGYVDLEVDHFGHLWVLDRDAGTITKYTYDLFPLCVFGSTGTGENQFIRPVSISDPVGYLGAANMFIVEDWTDSSGEQYFAIGTDVVDFSVTSSFDQYFHDVNFVLVSPSKVRINIYNAQGSLVKNVLNASILSGDCSFGWDGKNTAGAEQPTAEYRVQTIDSSTVIDVTTGAPTNVVTKEAWFHHEFNCCDADGIRGDVNGSCSPTCINILDLNYLTALLFQSGPQPPCPTEGNVDGAGTIGILDLTYLVNYLFRGGPAPPACP